LGFPQCRPDRVLCGSLVAHGWNIEHRCSSVWFRPSTPLPSGGGWNGVGRPVGYVARCWVLRDRTTLPFGVGVMVSSGLHRYRLGWWVWGFWPSVENYIVDASILEAALWAVSQKVSRQSGAFRGAVFGVFTGQFRSTFGCCTNSIELM
jgi:hypothetical protein